eukprot:m.70761 g.70761  ORF g.70761 m.70761 type:complete len:512 (-) comp24272_c1_seq1:80-1615(-)
MAARGKHDRDVAHINPVDVLFFESVDASSNIDDNDDDTSKTHDVYDALGGDHASYNQYEAPVLQPVVSKEDEYYALPKIASSDTNQGEVSQDRAGKRTTVYTQDRTIKNAAYEAFDSDPKLHSSRYNPPSGPHAQTQAPVALLRTLRQLQVGVAFAAILAILALIIGVVAIVKLGDINSDQDTAVLPPPVSVLGATALDQNVSALNGQFDKHRLVVEALNATISVLEATVLEQNVSEQNVSALNDRLNKHVAVLEALSATITSQSALMDVLNSSVQSQSVVIQSQSLIIQSFNATVNEQSSLIQSLSANNTDQDSQIQHINQQLKQLLMTDPSTTASSTILSEPTLEEVVAELVQNVSALQGAVVDFSPLNIHVEHGFFGEQMNAIAVVGSVDIYFCDSGAFDSVETIDGTFSLQTPALTNISCGFTSLITVGGYFNIYSNAALTTISGFTNLTTIKGYLRIQNNPKLTNFEGLRKITCVKGGIMNDSPSQYCQNCPQWLIDIAAETKGKC